MLNSTFGCIAFLRSATCFLSAPDRRWPQETDDLDFGSVVASRISASTSHAALFSFLPAKRRRNLPSRPEPPGLSAYEYGNAKEVYVECRNFDEQGKQSEDSCRCGTISLKSLKNGG